MTPTGFIARQPVSSERSCPVLSTLLILILRFRISCTSRKLSVTQCCCRHRRSYVGKATNEQMVITKDPVVSIIGLKVKDGLEISTPKKTTTKKGTRSQILACASVQAVQALAGLAMAHSSSLIPQLEAEDSEIPLTRDQSAWIASLITLTVPIGSLIGGYLTDAVGRLNSVKLSAVPYIVSCVVIATAQSFMQLLIGRLIVGASIGMGINCAILYTAEVAEKNVRGILSCLGTAFASLGIVLGYIFGAVLSWRNAAWVYCAAPVVLLALLFAFAAESPIWLRENGKDEAARKASTYFYNDPEKVLSSAKDSEAETSLLQKFKMLFCEPAGLKPFLLVNSLFILQQVSGVYITVSYAVTFFQESGSNLDPYLATIVLGLIRFAFATGTSLMAGCIGRRPFLMFSSALMGVCMLASGLATEKILQSRAADAAEPPEEWLSWVVVVSVMMYVAFGGLGLQVLPWGMMAEVFPHEVRSVAQPINTGTSHLYMFCLLQLYPTLSYWLGGSAGVQFLFAGTCFFSSIFSWVFVVETKGRTLQEIEEYFRHNTVYVGSGSRAKKRATADTNASAGS